MAHVTFIPIEKSDDFPMNNLFMTFHFEGGEVARFGYVITAKAFYAFVASNNVGRLREEDVEFPDIFMHGGTSRALVHYVDGEKFTCYVPVFPTEAEMDEYDAAFRR